MKTTLTRLMNKLQPNLVEKYVEEKEFAIESFHERDGKIYLVLSLEDNPDYNPALMDRIVTHTAWKDNKEFDDWEEAEEWAINRAWEA